MAAETCLVVSRALVMAGGRPDSPPSLLPPSHNPPGRDLTFDLGKWAYPPCTKLYPASIRVEILCHEGEQIFYGNVSTLFWGRAFPIQRETNFNLRKEQEFLSFSHVFQKETLQELRMLSRSLTDCKSLFLNIMIQVSQFVSNSQLCH